MSAQRRLVLAARCLLAGFCLAASVPPWGWWPLAFVGVALLDRLVADQRALVRFRRTWLVAAAWLYPALFWMWDFTAPGYVLAGALFAAFFGVALALCPPGRWRWLALPGLLVLAEAARWTVPFGGVPLGTLAMSQAQAPLGQTARVLGSLLIVGLVGVGGVALSAAWDRRWSVAVGALAGVVVVWGVALVAPKGHDVGPLRVAVVQGGGPQHTRADDAEDAAVFARHVAATETITDPVDLVLWPEDVVALEVPIAVAAERDTLSHLSQQLDTTLIAGVTEDVGDTRFLNASIVFNPDGTMGERYDKVHLVPFGEYVPGRSLFTKLAGNALPPRDAIAGHGTGVLDTVFGPVGTVISWEVFFPQRARSAIGHGGEVLLNPTNGSSYWLDIIQSQQLASSRLRAIETGRWTLQAAPTGFSAIVTPEGRITQRTGTSEQKVLQQTIQRRQGQTLATVVGPWPMLALAVLAVAGAWVGQRRRAPTPTSSA